MGILGWELRKIINPGIVTAIILLGVVYYFLFPEFYIQYFCNGANAEAEFALSAEWVARCGVTIESSERLELDAQLADEMEVFRQGLASMPEALGAGITDYDSFCEHTDKYLEQTAANGSVADMEQERLRWQIMSGTNYYRVQALEQFLVSYDMADRGVDSGRVLPDYYTDAMRRRDEELMQSGQKYGFSRPVSMIPHGNTDGIWQSGVCSALCCCSRLCWCVTACAERVRCSGVPAAGDRFCGYR